jgi:hypothetical protein
MNPQSNPQPHPQRILSPSSSRSRASTFRNGFSRHRWLLYPLAGLILLVMAIGLLFVAHQYYLEFGGQGWLKTRKEGQGQNEISADNLFLPLRKQEIWSLDTRRKSPQNDVAYYECGDQQNSCETYNQPVGGISYYLLTMAMLTSKPEHMLPSLDGVLRGFIHSVGNLLLQCVGVTIRLSSLRVPPTEVPSISCRMPCCSWWWMLPKKRRVFPKWMHTHFNSLHPRNFSQLNNHVYQRRHVRSCFCFINRFWRGWCGNADHDHQYDN